MSERKVVARWESEGGKFFAELYQDEWGFGYTGTNCGGNLGKIHESDALDFMEKRTLGSAGYFHPGKRPMRQMIPAGDTSTGARVADRDNPDHKGTVAEEFGGYTVVVSWDHLGGQRVAHERVRLINFTA